MSDTLTVKQRDWLAGLVKPGAGGKAPVAAKSDVAAARLKAREQVLATALAEIDKVKDRLAEASHSIEVMDAKGQRLKLLTGELDPDAEIDTHADIQADSDIENAKLLPEIARLMAVVVTQQERLRDAATKPDGTLAEDGHGDKLFGEADIATEIWTPLVRAGVLPENLVQKRYSEVAKTFAGAQANYAKRLEAFSEAEESKDSLAETLGVGAEVLETAGRAANLAADGILELRGADKALKDNVKVGISLIAAAGVLGLNVGLAVLSAADRAKLVKAVVDTVKAAFGVSGMADSTQKIAGKAIDAVLHGNKFLASLSKGQAGAAIDALGEAFESGMAAAGEYTGDKELSRTYAAIGSTVKGLIKTSAAAKKVHDAPAGDTDALLEAFTDLAKEAADLAAHAVKSKIESDDRLAKELQTKEIAGALKEKVVAAQTQIEAIMKACLTEETDLPAEMDSIVESSKAQLALDASTKLTEKWQELLRSAAKGQDPAPISRDIGVLITDLTQKAAALDALRNDVAEQVKAAGERTAEINPEEEDEDDEEDEDEEEEPSEAVQAIMAKLKAATDGIEPETAILIDAESKARLEAMQQDREEFAAKLANDFTAVVDETDDAIQQARLAVNKLEPLVAQTKRDRAWLKLADTLASAGTKLGAAMFEGLNPVESFKTCAVNIYTGIQHLQEVNKWQANMADSRNAGASALLAAEFNRAGLEQRYLTTEWVNGAIKALEGIGTTLKVTGINAPVGKLMETGGKAAGETAKLVTKYFAASRLKSAWSDYQEAMLDPENRKKVRAALRSNATLAKYALAWAATEARDPLAREAMRKCGLSDAVLADEETNAQAVVEYLETLYDKDPVVLKASPNPSRWWPGKPELSARSWIKFLSAAEATEAGLRGASGVLVTQLLVRMEKLMPAAVTQPVDETAVAAARAALDELIEVLTDYDPLDEAGEPQAEMRRYADIPLAQAELKRRTLPDRQ